MKDAVTVLSDFLVESIAIHQSPPDVAIIGLIDAAVRVIKAHRPTMDNANACRELSRIVLKIGKVEATN